MERVARLAVPAVLVIGVYYALMGGEHSVFDLRGARSELEASRAELARLRQENDSLRAWVDSLRSDPWTIERIAREEHGLIRDGEELVRFGEVAEPPPDSAEGGEGR